VRPPQVSSRSVRTSRLARRLPENRRRQGIFGDDLGGCHPGTASAKRPTFEPRRHREEVLRSQAVDRPRGKIRSRRSAGRHRAPWRGWGAGGAPIPASGAPTGFHGVWRAYNNPASRLARRRPVPACRISGLYREGRLRSKWPWSCKPARAGRTARSGTRVRQSRAPSKPESDRWRPQFIR
jgi:hypothetical protein